MSRVADAQPFSRLLPLFKKNRNFYAEASINLKFLAVLEDTWLYRR